MRMITEMNHPDAIHVIESVRVDNTDPCANIDVAAMGLLIPAVIRPPGGQLPTYPCDFFKAPVFKPEKPKVPKKVPIVTLVASGTRSSARLQLREYRIIEGLTNPEPVPTVPVAAESPRKSLLKRRSHLLGKV